MKKFFTLAIFMILANYLSAQINLITNGTFENDFTGWNRSSTGEINIATATNYTTVGNLLNANEWVTPPTDKWAKMNTGGLINLKLSQSVPGSCAGVPKKLVMDIAIDEESGSSLFFNVTLNNTQFFKIIPGDASPFNWRFS